MEHFFSLVQSVIILVVLILLTFYLKRRKVVEDRHNVVFSRLVTDYTLPALIFSSLARQHFDTSQLLPPLIMFASILISMAIGWGAGKILRLPAKKLGVFIVLAGFGSSSSLGYPLIKQVFPENQQALTDALLIGELGACLPFFVIGVGILMFYGRKEGEEASIFSSLIPFLKSPIFISMALGLLCSFIGLPQNNHVINLVFQILSIIGGSMLFLVAISIGLMLKPFHLKNITWIVVAIVLIKLVIEPLLCMGGASMLGVAELEKEILVIEAGMPSGAVATVVANRYGCDGSFGSTLVIITYILAMISVPLMFYLSLM